MRFMRFVFVAGLLGLGLVVAPAANTVSPWAPIFRGIEQATGTNNESGVSLSVNALRIDLHDPEIRLFVTPPVATNYVANQRETLLQTPREFLVEHRLQAAVNSGYFNPAGYGNPSGTPAWVEGLVLSQGRLVSAQTSSNDSLSAILFATNNQPTFVYLNWPAASTAGVFNAVAGMYPLLSNGVNISFAYTNDSSSIHLRQPRTAFGLSQDNRHLIIVTIDGRQQDFSDGALDSESAEFLLLFGAWQGMNMDGGGSTCLVKLNDCGDPVDINQNSFQFAVNRPGSQRPVGCNFGVWAPALASPINELTVVPSTTTAIITWRTEVEATTQVEYGPTPSYGSNTPLDSRLRRFHIATLSGLTPGSNYYYRALSTAGTEQYAFACRFSNIVSQTSTQLFLLTNSWKFTTNNLNGVNWTAPGYADTNWLGEGPALLHVENSAFVAPKNTALPPPFGQPIPRTYYFRTHFGFSGNTPSSLIFSNYVDDGAVFYLNGAEVYRLRMPVAPTIIVNNTAANGTPCSGTFQAGDAATNCPDVFAISGPLLTNLVQGDNVVAVEVHNGASGGDLVFGSALIQVSPAQIVPRLHLWMEENVTTLYWNGEGFRLQQSSDLTSPQNWADLPGPPAQSPVTLTNSGSVFYRLRN
jgi:phosphodiester glycosidase/purple acid phosphatase-like protein